MILSGEEIKRRIGEDIQIDPFDEARLNANSYDLTLHNELLVYEEVVLDLSSRIVIDELKFRKVG